VKNYEVDEADVVLTQHVPSLGTRTRSRPAKHRESIWSGLLSQHMQHGNILRLCGGHELGIRQGGSGEYRRPPNARGHSAKRDFTPSLDPFPLQPTRRCLTQVLAEEGLASQPSTYLLLGNHLGLSIPLPRAFQESSRSSASPSNSPTHHLRPRRLQTTRLHPYVSRPSSPHNTTCWPLHLACPQHTALAQQKQKNLF
jgi:hypothetical protein